MSRFASAVLLLLGSAAVVALSPTHKTTPMLWSTPIVPLAQSNPPITTPFDGKHVVIAQDNGVIASLDSDTGAVEWTYTSLNATDQIISQISPIPMKAVIVWASTAVVALDPKTGAEMWSNTKFVPSSMLTTEQVVLLYSANTPPVLLALSPMTGKPLYTFSLNTVSISNPITCGAGLACWMQFPNDGSNGQAVVFDLKAGSILHATTLPVSQLYFVKDFSVTDIHIIVVYAQYVNDTRLGVAIAAVDLFNGAIGWSQSLTLAGQSRVYPLAIGEGIVSLIIGLQDADVLTSVVNLNGFDERTGAVVLNSTFNYTSTLDPFPVFSELHNGRIWMFQDLWTPQGTLLNMTAFDTVTGQLVINFVTPGTSALPRIDNVYISTASGPRWVIPNSVGVTVYDGLTGAFVSSTTSAQGIIVVQQTTDAKIILTTNITSAVIALQP